MLIVVFLGAPGSGKGTQAKRLSEVANFIHFSTGDMLRKAVEENSEIGRRAKAYIDRGELVPDSVMIELIEKSLSLLPDNSKVIFDGFPRTVPQAEALDKKVNVKRVVYFNVPEENLISRLTGRRICQKCGEPYHIKFLPPKVNGICDKCGSNLIQRTDDSEEVVKRRLGIYRHQTTPLLTYYQEQDKLIDIRGDRPVETIEKTLLSILR